MKYQFEIYALTDQLLTAHWSRLHKVLLSYLGQLGKFEILFSCKDNVVRFFISCDKDLSSLSNSLDGMLLRAVDDPPLELPKTTAKETGVQFVSGGNLLDLKEKHEVKRERSLQFVHFKVRMMGASRALVGADLLFVNSAGQWTKSYKVMAFVPVHLLSVDFAHNTHYLKKAVPKYLNIEKSLHMLTSENVGALFHVDTFPYFSHDYYLSLTSYDFDKHSFIIGASGSGKSKFISLFVDRLYHTALKMNYRVVVIDPHASIAEDFSHIEQRRIITFGAQDGADLFPGAGTDLTSATELTATLFKSILGDQFNARLDRMLRYALFTLMTAQTMTLENLKRFLTDVEYRMQVTQHVTGYVPVNVTKFFGADFNELRTHYYESTILPLVTMVDEMQLQPSLVGESETSLAKVIQENFLTVFSLNKVSMGEKVVKTVAGLLIQQIFLLALARVFGQKIILIVDEVSVVQNPAIAQILAEARKFNLTVILTQQYFGQVDKELRDAIFANVFNYYTFKVSEEDARALEGNLNIELPKELVESEHAKGISQTETKVKMMTELHPRQCLVRVVSNGQIAPAIKATTVVAPIAVDKVLPRADLVPVRQQALPKKFVERSASAQTGIRLSKGMMQKMVGDDSGAPADDTQKPTAPRASAGLRSILSTQSSSRTKVTGEDKK
ncbi:MAG TPA: DUF87 domain-containing protein [Candidatus Saccharimonadales bacterium]